MVYSDSSVFYISLHGSTITGEKYSFATPSTFNGLHPRGLEGLDIGPPSSSPASRALATAIAIASFPSPSPRHPAQDHEDLDLDLDLSLLSSSRHYLHPYGTLQPNHKGHSQALGPSGPELFKTTMKKKRKCSALVHEDELDRDNIRWPGLHRASLRARVATFAVALSGECSGDGAGLSGVAKHDVYQ